MEINPHKDIARNEPEQIAFGYTTLCNRLDKLQGQILESAERYEGDSDASAELRIVHAALAEIMTKNIKLRHKVAKKANE